MKVLLTFVPQWTPISPHFALPSLSAQLKRAGFQTLVMDLNIDFYDKILNREYIINAIERSVSGQKQLLEYISKFYDANKSFKDYPLVIQNKMIKYSRIKEYVTKRQKDLEQIPDYVEGAKAALKDKRGFFTPEVLIKSMSILDEALDMASLPHYPTKMSLDSCSNPLFKLNFESIKYYVFDKETNIFLDYYNSKLDEIKEIDAQYIGISINSSSQIIAGLTLAHLLKENTNAHINIGGNFFGRVVDEVSSKKEFFELFCHSLLVEEGELPVVDLGKYIRGDIEIEEVSNLVYPKDGKIKRNAKKAPMKLDEMANLNLDGFELDKYLTPEIILPIQSSRGCYWGKCSFCDQGFGQNFNVKNPKTLVENFKELKEKYGVDKFEFIDESLSPVYMEELSEELGKNNVKINYFTDARLESTFSYDILSKAYKNGLKMILWGLESGSEKIMDLINKGIDVSRRLEILKNSSDAGIWNFAFIFFGFPAETIEDAQKTIDLITSNTDVIHSYGRSIFTMGKHTKIKEDPKTYGIEEVYPAVDEFMPSYTFKSSGMKSDELSFMTKKCTNSCLEAYHNPLWMYLRYREYLFLYLTKFSQKEISSYEVKL